jgi:hypothetical protein
MMKAVENFLVKIQEQEHVFPLIQNADLHVNLRSEGQLVQLVIKNGAIFILQNPDVQQLKYEISGNEDIMKQLFEGTERLRILEQNGQLKVNAPLRIILLLESLFYLTQAQEDFRKIV